MEISEILNTATPIANTGPSDQVGRDDFLRMLIAQLENQDPLDPQDATEFTAQLATFSSLDQLVSMRTSIDALTSAAALTDGVQAASLVGREVLVESKSLSVVEGAPLPTVVLDVPARTDVLSVEIEDALGRTVATATQLDSLAPGRHELDWDDFEGEVGAGRHEVRVNVAPSAPEPSVLVRAPVDAAALSASGAVLLLGENEVPLTALLEVR